MIYIFQDIISSTGLPIVGFQWKTRMTFYNIFESYSTKVFSDWHWILISYLSDILLHFLTHGLILCVVQRWFMFIWMGNDPPLNAILSLNESLDITWDWLYTYIHLSPQNCVRDGCLYFLKCPSWFFQWRLVCNVWNKFESVVHYYWGSFSHLRVL